MIAALHILQDGILQSDRSKTLAIIFNWMIAEYGLDYIFGHVGNVVCLGKI